MAEGTADVMQVESVDVADLVAHWSRWGAHMWTWQGGGDRGGGDATVDAVSLALMVEKGPRTRLVGGP